jgi:apolipoprotein N-acyltransferase
MSPLAFVALVPALLLCSRDSCSRIAAFRNGWAVGFLFHLGTLWWIAKLYATEITYPWMRIPILLLLAAYEAVFYGVAFWGWRIVSRTRFWFLWPGIWVSTEYLRSLTILAFPWTVLANSLSSMPVLLQPAALGGVWILDFGLAFVNVVVARVLLGFRRILLLTAAGGVVMVWLVTGILAMDSEDGEMCVALVQPNALPEFKWQPGASGRVFSELKMLSRAAAESLECSGPRLVVLPETAIPREVRPGGGIDWWLRDLVAGMNTPLITGALGRGEEDGEILPTNAAYLVLPQEGVAARYDKMHLVPFSEKMPFSRHFKALKDLNFGQGDYAVGRDVVLLDVNGVKASVLICFEAILPGLVRRHVLSGAHLLVNITNDSWFGDTGAPEQHAAITAIRAVEHRRWLVRSANTGVSMVVDPYGRVMARTGLFKQAILIADVQPRQSLSLYTKLGDWVAWLSLVSAGLAVVIGLTRGERR